VVEPWSPLPVVVVELLSPLPVVDVEPFPPLSVVDVDAWPELLSAVVDVDPPPLLLAAADSTPTSWQDVVVVVLPADWPAQAGASWVPSFGEAQATA
jgi:hypothetical protein